MKLVRRMTLLFVILFVGSVAVSALASDSTNLMHEIMFERDEESTESSETAILDGILTFSIPSDWEKSAEEELSDEQRFQYRCTDEDGITVLFEGIVMDSALLSAQEVYSYSDLKGLLENEKVDHIAARFKGIEMILTGDDATAIGICLTWEGKLLGFEFESGNGKIADVAQSEKLVKDMTTIIQSIKCLSDDDLACFGETFWNEDASEDVPDADASSVDEDAKVSFFEAITSIRDASVDTYSIYFGDQLVLTVPDDWVEIEPEDAICAFMGTDEAGNRAIVDVVAVKGNGITLEELAEDARNQRCCCTITANGRTFFTVLTDTAIVSAWLTEDDYILMVAAYPDSDQAMRSEKLIRDQHQILCGLRPVYDGELEQLEAREELEGKEEKGEPVSFHDAEFERMVRAAMKRAAEEPIYASELEAIRNLSIRTGKLTFSQDISVTETYQQPGVLDLSDLVLFPNLRYLSITNMKCTGFETLTELRELCRMILIRTGLTDCGFVSGMNLNELNLAGNKLSDFSPIASLTDLKELNLYDTGLDSLEVLRGLDLTLLVVGNNPISDLDPIAHMTSLTSLSIQHTNVESLEVLRNFRELEMLNISELNGQISLEPVYEHEKLQHLICYGTSISDMDKEKLESVLH